MEYSQKNLSKMRSGGTCVQMKRDEVSLQNINRRDDESIVSDVCNRCARAAQALVQTYC